MNFGKRIISAGLSLLLLGGAFLVGTSTRGEVIQDGYDYTTTLNIWYTDEALTDYLSSVAVRYNEETGIRVIPVLQTGLELLEKINRESLALEGSTPDLYIASHDIMEKANLAGLATEITNPDNLVSTVNFPETAIRAVTYQGKLGGYPFSYETSALLYNRSYLTTFAEEQILNELRQEQEAREEEEQETDSSASEDEEAAQGTGVLIAEEELSVRASERVAELIPPTFTRLLEFADSYNAPENVDAVFKWDVSDIFFNYFFVGNYFNLGGPAGDDVNAVDVYNREAIAALQEYQDLGQYFAIDAKEVAYETVLRDFIEGKVVMTTATSDVIRILEAARQAGEFEYEYGLAPIPDLSDEMHTRNLSITNVVYINGYSPLKEEANNFAAALTGKYAGDLYSMAGKVSANRKASEVEEVTAVFMEEYEDSVPLPKMMVTSNFWLQMEIVFDRIWNGEEVSSRLMELSELIKSQIQGEAVSESYIFVPKETEEYVEYEEESSN